MKIKLLVDLPIHPAHGAKKGRVFEVTETQRAEPISQSASQGRLQGYLFMGDADKVCTAFPMEVEVLDS